MAEKKPCEYCRAYILWVKGPRGGNVPVDALPHKDGTYFLQETGGTLYGGPTTRVQRDGMRARGVPLHQPHRETCPQATVWAKGPLNTKKYRTRGRA